MNYEDKKCGFCCKSFHDVSVLIVSDDTMAAICDVCVETCIKIIFDNLRAREPANSAKDE